MTSDDDVDHVTIERHGPGPRPMGPNLKTTVRVHGVRQVAEFRALCFLLGRRPHQLAADLVLEGIRRAREDPELGPALVEVVAGIEAAAARRTNERASNVIQLHRPRRHRP